MVDGLNLEKYKKTIIYLLKANNCLEEYKEEIKLQCKEPLNTVLTSLFRDCIGIGDFVYYSFDTDESIKGWQYWSFKVTEMNKMFRNQYFEIIDLNQKEWDD